MKLKDNVLKMQQKMLEQVKVVDQLEVMPEQELEPDQHCDKFLYLKILKMFSLRIALY